jgi:outer membrane biosynthesis protein TonB
MQLTLSIDTKDADDLTLAEALVRAAREHFGTAPAAAPQAADAAPATTTASPAAETPRRGRPRKVEQPAAPAAEQQTPATDPPEEVKPQQGNDAGAEQGSEESSSTASTESSSATAASGSEQAEQPAATEAAEEVTLDDLRGLVRGLMGKNSANKDKIAAVLKQHNAVLLPDLKPEQYPAVAAALKGL